MSCNSRCIPTRSAGTLAALALATALSAGPSAHGQDALAPLVAKAKQEGMVNIFMGTARYPESAANQLAQAFTAKFGIPIKVTLVAPGPHPSIVQQVIAETKSGVRPALDLFPTALSLLLPMRDAGAVAKIDWVALGVPAKQIAPPGDSVQISTIARNIIYNTNLVKKDEAPKQIQDLADPKWKGKIVAPALGDIFSVMGVPVIGEPATVELVRKLANDQKISLVQSVTDVGTKVANGEFALGIGVPADWTGLRKKGAPVENAPLQKVSGQPFQAVVLANAEHPAAATLMTYFVCCTPEGEKALYELIGWANFDTPNTEPYEIGSNGRGINPSYEFQTKEQARISRELAKILGL